MKALRTLSAGHAGGFAALVFDMVSVLDGRQKCSMPEEKHVGTGRTNCTSQRPKGIHLLQESRSQRTRDRSYSVGVCIYIRCLRIEPRPAFIDSLGAQRSSPCARQRHCRNSRLILPSKSAHSPMLIDVNLFRVVLYHRPFVAQKVHNDGTRKVATAANTT